ncbi:MAG: VWA domain-containing protein [Betaproteobacteria bacterium]|nr:VWA domain-containing protein [Betaproteobacteria bacterium]
MSKTPSSQQVIDEQLTQLRDSSLVAFRELEQVLPAIRPHGEDVVLAWILACRRLHDYDREAGRAFIHGSREAERISETVAPWTGQALQFMRWRGAWRALEGFMANLPRAYGSLGHAGQRRWAEIGFVWCDRQIDSGSAYFTTPVVDLSGRQGITGIEQLTQPAEELFESRKLLLATYLAGAIRVRNLLGAQAILPWAMRGADILQAGRARGEAYFRLESEESLALLLDQLPGFRLLERYRLLSMLLDVWYGGQFELKEGSWSPEKGRPFVETDGRSIYFPAVMPNRDEAVISALHTAGHMRFGTFDRLAMKELFGEAGLEFPESGPVSWAPLFARYGDDALRFQLIFDLCEDLRIDYRVQQLVPNHLQRLLATARSGARHPETGVYYGLAVQSVEQALAALIDKYGNDGVRDERFAPLLRPSATVADAWRIAVAIYSRDGLPPVSDLEAFHAAYLPGRGPNTTRLAHPQQQDQQRQQTQSGAEGEQRPQEGGEQQDPSLQNAESGDQRDGGRTQEITGFGDASGASSRAAGRSEEQRQNTGSSDKGVAYPEWDYRESRYKRNWSWVQEKKLAESNITETNRLMNQYAVALKRLKKAIQAQKPTRLAPKLRQLDGEDMDLNAVVGYVVEKKAGRSPKPAIYRRREMRQREIAVTLLADMSTSIMQHLPEGGGRLVDRVRAGVLLFAESMEEVGDPYSIAGFCSKYRDNVSYYAIKDFEQPLSQDIRSQIGGMSGRLATRMGAAIRHATASFERIESRRRLLLILSDGRPEDYDDGGDRRYLHEDTRMAVKEAVARGVHPFCITVDTMANQYLPQIFGRGHYMVLDHINSLPNKLPEIYFRLRR